MAKIAWAKGIDYVSGLLSKRPKKGEQHSDHQNALLATHRVAETTNPVCNRIYMVGAYNRVKPVTSAEVNRRKKFGDIGEMVATRMTDLMTITQDRQAFEAQKNTAGGKKTFKSYLWKVCKEAYEANH